MFGRGGGEKRPSVQIGLNYLGKLILQENSFKKTIVYEGLQYGGKQKSVILLVKNLEV